MAREVNAWRRRSGIYLSKAVHDFDAAVEKHGFLTRITLPKPLYESRLRVNVSYVWQR